MKKSLRRIMAGVSAAAMLATAMPVVNAFAEEEVAEATISYREVAEGVIITDYVCDAAELVIPEKTEDGKTVVGVDNFAFALVSKDVDIVVPSTLMASYVGDFAFMTSVMINAQLVEVSGADTVEGVVKYWVNEKGMSYTDEQIANAVAKAKANAGVTDEMTTEQAAVLVMKEIVAGNCDFAEENVQALKEVLGTFAYNEVTLEGDLNPELKELFKDKWNLTYLALGDMTLDDEINLYDAVEIAKYMMKMIEVDPTSDAFKAGDITQDGELNLYDAVEVCKIIMG